MQENDKEGQLYTSVVCGTNSKARAISFIRGSPGKNKGSRIESPNQALL